MKFNKLIILSMFLVSLIIVSHLSFETTVTEIEATIDTLEENLPGITFSVFHPTILKQMIYIKEGGSIRVIDKPTS